MRIVHVELESARSSRAPLLQEVDPLVGGGDDLVGADHARASHRTSVRLMAHPTALPQYRRRGGEVRRREAAARRRFTEVELLRVAVLIHRRLAIRLSPRDRSTPIRAPSLSIYPVSGSGQCPVSHLGCPSIDSAAANAAQAAPLPSDPTAAGRCQRRAWVLSPGPLVTKPAERLQPERGSRHAA